MERQGTFDYILLETTGLADPGNIAPIFWVDDGLGSTIYLDGIVTLVDAKHILRSLDEPTRDESVHDDDIHATNQGQLLSTAHLQISHADVIVVNKSDLVSTEELDAVKARVRSINSMAKLHVTDHGQVPQLEGLVLDLHAYDNVTADSLEFASKGHSHLDPAIGTMVLKVPILEAAQLELLDEWLRAVLWESSLPHSESATQAGWEIHRVKGRFPVRGGGLKILQGVREIFELIEGIPEAESPIEGKIVLIGRNIGGKDSQTAFQQSLDESMAGKGT